MTRPYQTFKNYLVESLKDPKEARVFLKGAMEAYEEDQDIEALWYPFDI